MTIKAKFEKGHFVPLDQHEINNLDSGNIVEIEIISEEEEKFKWKGALKHLKKGSVELQHEIKNAW